MSLPPTIPIIDTLAEAKSVDVVALIAWTDGKFSRLTSCRGGFRMPANEIEFVDGAYYSALPRLTEVPALKQLINGTSDEVTMAMSGLPSAVQAIVDEEPEAAEGAIIRIGKAYWGRKLELLSVIWALTLTGGEVGTRTSGGKRQGGRYSPGSVTISLSATTSQSRRASSSLSYWTDAQHQMREPGDTFFTYVGSLSVGAVKAWPKA